MRLVYVRSPVFESHKVVYDELVIRKKQKRLSTERSAVQCFAFFMLDRPLDDLDHKFRIFCFQFVFRVVQVVVEPVYSLPDGLAGYLLAASNALRVLHDLLQVLCFIHSCSFPSVLLSVLILSPLQLHLRGSSSVRPGSAPDRASMPGPVRRSP